MAREPGYGELLGRMDDLESEVDGLRKVLAVVLVVGVVLWFDLRQSKEAKSVD